MKTRRSMTARLNAIKVNPERVARLTAVGIAIRAGKAYLDTFNGRRKVTSYNDETGYAITNNRGHSLDDQHFMVCLESIKIDA